MTPDEVIAKLSAKCDEQCETIVRLTEEVNRLEKVLGRCCGNWRNTGILVIEEEAV